MKTVRVIMASFGVIVSLAAFGIPLIFGFITGKMGVDRGRYWLQGFNLGVWFGPFYLWYLATQPKLTYVRNDPTWRYEKRPPRHP